MASLQNGLVDLCISNKIPQKQQLSPECDDGPQEESRDLGLGAESRQDCSCKNFKHRDPELSVYGSARPCIDGRMPDPRIGKVELHSDETSCCVSGRWQDYKNRMAEGSVEEYRNWVDGRCGSLGNLDKERHLDESNSSEGILMIGDETYGDREEDFIRREFAHHETGVARINNGSFGCCPASVLKSQARWAELFLQQPDKFYFGPLQEGLRASRRAIASLIHAADEEELCLVDNVTTAVAIVLQRLACDFWDGRFQKGDAVLTLSWAYGAVKKALKAYPLRAGAELIEVELQFPITSKDQIISSLQESLEYAKRESKRIRFALIDHITSMPSAVLPIRELVGICRRAGVDEIFVDGAHAIGNVEVNVQEIDADYYTSNLHKWLFAPPSVAFIHCKPRLMPSLHHPIVSHNYETGLSNECDWVGTRDYSAQLAAADAIKFFNKFKGGLNAVRERNHSQVVLVGQMLASSWGTHCGVPPEMCSAMMMVGLPPELGINSHEDAFRLRTCIREDFGVEVHIYFVSDPSSVTSDSKKITAYVRISHQIYNKMNDYIRLRDAVNSLVADAVSQLK